MNHFLRNASIGIKVAIAPSVAIACLVIVAGLGLVGARSLTADLERVGSDSLERVSNAQAYATQFTQMQQRLYQSLTWEASGQRAERIKALDDSLLRELRSFGTALEGASYDESLLPTQQEALQAVLALYSPYAKSVVDTLDMKSAGVANAAGFIVTVDQHYEKLTAQIDAFVAAEKAVAASTIEHARARSERLSMQLLAMAALAALLCGGLTMMLTRAIRAPLARAASSADALAQGDLRIGDAERLSADATGQVLASMRQISANLSTIVGEVRGTADQINTAATELAHGTIDLSGRTEQTAASLEETAASVEQLSATLQHNADNARQANGLARQASAVASEGRTVVAEVVSIMEAINTQARKIGEIIGVIDAIAFQTNILALNAAVEAARAGEQGRGFAVVAQEVRALASRSAEAARQIRSLIGSSIGQIDAGVSKVQEAGATMGRIVKAIQQVSSTVDAISRATQEQASGIAQVNQAVSEMDKATQQNAAMVEQATAATESLRGQAEQLVQSLSRFRT